MKTDLQSWDDLSDLDNYVKENNLIIIDGNNLAYRWINRANYNNFGEDYINTVKSLAKSYKAARIIVAYDFGKSYFRLGIYPHYKANRKPPTDPDEMAKYEAFFACLNETIEQLPLENYKFRGVEADDIIAFFADNVVNFYDHIWIVSSDRDLYQLINDKISIFNLYSRKEITADSLLEEKGVTPDEHLLAKIIAGDSGDGIPGIEGIGEKRSQNLAREYLDLTSLILALPIKKSSKYIKNLNAGKDILLLNEQLINLKKYYEKAIKQGKAGEKYWDTLLNSATGQVTYE